MSIEEKTFNILVIGPGRAFFEELQQNHKDNFTQNGFYLNLSEGFSTLEITNVIVNIGTSIITGVSTYYITQLIDSIFSAKNKAKESGVEMNISITINQGNQYIQVSSNQEQVKEELLKKCSELNKQ